MKNNMLKTIKTQLEKVNFADLSNFDAQNNVYHIKRYSKPKYEVNSCYLVKIPDSIVNKADSLCATNWNNGSFPTMHYLKIVVTRAIGKMIYVDGLGYDITTKADMNYMWSGWLPTEELDQLAKI